MSTNSLGNYDCVIIGGGPAGLLCAVYLARFKRNVILFDREASRAALIPLSHNYPGAVNGISGKDILGALRKQVAYYQVKIINEVVIKLEKNNKFKISSEKSNCEADYVVLATGSTDVQPTVSHVKKLIDKGLLRHCLVCDGFEVINQEIAVIGNGEHALNEAKFLLSYTNKITVFLPASALTLSLKQKFAEANIKVNINNINDVINENNKIIILLDNQKKLSFDAAYAALGARANASLAQQLQVVCGENNCITTDHHQRTSIEGLYAAGDVVEGLNQIVTAYAQAAIAATDIHHCLLHREGKK